MGVNPEKWRSKRKIKKKKNFAIDLKN